MVWSVAQTLLVPHGTCIMNSIVEQDKARTYPHNGHSNDPDVDRLTVDPYMSLMPVFENEAGDPADGSERTSKVETSLLNSSRLSEGIRGGWDAEIHSSTPTRSPRDMRYPMPTEQKGNNEHPGVLIGILKTYKMHVPVCVMHDTCHLHSTDVLDCMLFTILECC